jgi:hypothetical protein
MKTEIEEIAGESKTIRALRPFRNMGVNIPEGATLEVDSETAKSLMSHRDGRTALGQLVGGGCFDLVRCSDGFHKVTPWSPHSSYPNDNWYRVEFLCDVPGLLVNAGDKRRLKVGFAREFPHKFTDSPPTGKNCTPAFTVQPVIIIHEERPRRMSDEERSQRQEAVWAGMAADAGSWMRPKN